MVSPNVDKIFREAQPLNDAEREELRSLFALSRLRNQELAKQDQVRQRGQARASGKRTSTRQGFRTLCPLAAHPHKRQTLVGDDHRGTR